MEASSRLGTCSQPDWTGLDVGGANLKVADGRGGAFSLPFALWREPERLVEKIRKALSLLANERPPLGIALTMTGELADCYATKAEGVRSIVEATVAAADGLPVGVATVEDAWLTPTEAIGQPQRVAAANWRLMARYALRWLGEGEEGLMVDIGSTTIDLIPLSAGAVKSIGRTDTERLLAGELLYRGVRRTPFCAIAGDLPYRGQACPVAAELFATTADAWLLLGELPESSRCDTADGRPFRRKNAIARLGRSLCADSSEFTLEDALAAAEALAAYQERELRMAMDRQIHLLQKKPTVLFLCGEGSFLGDRVQNRLARQVRTLRLADVVASKASECGPAHAAAVLASEELLDNP